jgi:hypothetical protein
METVEMLREFEGFGESTKHVKKRKTIRNTWYIGSAVQLLEKAILQIV